MSNDKPKGRPSADLGESLASALAGKTINLTPDFGQKIRLTPLASMLSGIPPTETDFGSGAGSAPAATKRKELRGEVGGDDPPKKRRPGRTSLDRVAGRREMKEYPLTKGEMRELASLQLLSTLAFSGASFALAFWLDLVKDIAFAKDLPATAVAYWSAWKTGAGWGAIVLFAIGLAFALTGHLRVHNIIKGTKHG